MAGSTLFSKLPNIKYDIQLLNEPKLMKNIFITTKVVDAFANNPLTHYEYEIKDGETPWKIAELYYENPNYWWIILFFNDIRDYYSEWPKSSENFQRYMDEKYEDIKETENAYYYYNNSTKMSPSTYMLINNWFKNKFENPKEDAGDSKPPFNNITYYQFKTFEKYSVYEYEFDRNEKNRVIKLLRLNYLEDFITEFEKMIKI